jgi:hypothetical protein
MKKLFFLFLLLPYIAMAQKVTPGHEILVIPISKIIANKSGSYDLNFYIHPLCGFPPKMAQILLVSDSIGKKPKTFNIENIRRIEQDEFGNSTCATIIANAELKKELKKERPRLAIFVMPENKLQCFESTLSFLCKNGTQLLNAQAQPFYHIDSMIVSNMTEAMQKNAIQNMVYAANTLGIQIKGTTKDHFIQKGKYFGLKISNLLEVTNPETIDQYLINLMIDKWYYAGQYVDFLANYQYWIENGAVVDVTRF